MRIKTQPICEHCGYDESHPNAPHQLPAGTVLKEQYLVGKVLGQGGFGITYLGWDLYLDIPVAIKEYFPSGSVMREVSITMEVVSCSGDEGVRFRNNKERFMREAKMLARFSQVPEIVQVRNFFLANNTAYIVMEYVEGINLKQYVKANGGKLSVEETFRILRPMIRTLCKVHKAGLVHRDISPDNIMMLPGGGAKLLDFGAVRDVGTQVSADRDLTKSTEAILKQGYAPIEQYQKRGALGPWTDVYALCATIYYCLTGQVPPDAPERLLEDEDMDFKAEIPELTDDQAAALAHGMELRAEKRTASMDELYEELFGAAKPEPVPQAPAEPIPVTAPVAVPIPEPVREPEPKTQRRPRTEIKPEPEKKTKPAPKTAAASQPAEEKRGKEKPKKNKKWMSVVAIAIVAIVVWAGLILLFQDGSGEDLPGISVQEENGRETISGTCGTHTKWTLDRDSGELTVTGNGDMWDFRPDWMGEEEGELPPWYDYRSEITTVRITDKVTKVGNYAFTGCDKLTYVEIGGTVDTIGKGAFQDAAVEEVEFTSGWLAILEWDCFHNTALREVRIPDTVTDVANGAFDHCCNLETVTIGKQTRLDYDTAMGQVFSRNEFEVSENITIRGYTNTVAEDYARIKGYNFESLGKDVWELAGNVDDQWSWYLDLDTGFLKIKGDGLPHFSDPEDPTNGYLYYAGLPARTTPWYDYRDRIRIVSMDDGITSIGEFAFAGCENLTDVHWSNNLETINYQAFLGCNLDEVVLPDSVTTIFPFAFNHCENLGYVQLPENLEILESQSFNACYGLTEFWVGQNTSIDDWDYSPFNQADEPGMPENLTIFSLPGTDAERFAADAGIPFEVGYRGVRAEDMGQCGDNVYWFKGGDHLFLYGSGETWIYGLNDEDYAALQAYHPLSWLHQDRPGFQCYNEEIRYIIILPGVEGLNADLFWDLPNLEWVDFGDLISIDCALKNTGITELWLPESLEEIGGYAFDYNLSLWKVVIGCENAVIYDGAFDNCSALREIWFTRNTRINGNILDTDGSEDAWPDLVFYVYAGSEPEQYAIENGISYEIIDE